MSNVGTMKHTWD